MKKFTADERREIGRQGFLGVPAQALAREYQCGVATVAGCMRDLLREMPGFSSQALFEELKVWGQGDLKAMKTLYMKLKARQEFE